MNVIIIITLWFQIVQIAYPCNNFCDAAISILSAQLWSAYKTGKYHTLRIIISHQDDANDNSLIVSSAGLPSRYLYNLNT